MALFDLPLAKLKKYRSPHPEPKDFDAFWKRTLKETARFPLDAQFVRLADPIYKLAEVYDLTFRGFGGQNIRGWFLTPVGGRRLATIVTFLGYGGGRSLPTDHLTPVVAGLAHLVMDTRGQGSSWAPGATGDEAGTGPQFPGFMTRGLDSPETYYYRRLFIDAFRAVEVAANHPLVDPARIAVSGGSQGGGIALAAAGLAGLAGRKVKLCLPDVPFLCHFRRATTLVNTSPYSEISNYLKCHRGRAEQVFSTLDYFDGVNLAARIGARCLFSVGLMDDTCPPSTVFAAYNRITAPKDIRIYDFNYHEGGGMFQVAEKLRYAAKYL